MVYFFLHKTNLKLLEIAINVIKNLKIDVFDHLVEIKTNNFLNFLFNLNNENEFLNYKKRLL